MFSSTPLKRNAAKALPAGASPVEAARLAGLRYVSDDSHGIRRVRAGKGFCYHHPIHGRVRDRETLDRIRGLAIPPAWTSVWICPLAHGHLQAVGRDARNRKQYRYHVRWRAIRDQTKYHHLIDFAERLPALRRQVARDLNGVGLSRRRVLATIVRLLETTLIRVGNQEYARENRHFGLTTLRNRHVRIGGARIRFEFRGKSGVRRSVDIHDPRLARIIKRCHDLPGQELFQYVDRDGRRHAIDSADVNDYLRRALGSEFTAKDFRTWAGTVLAARALHGLERSEAKTRLKKNIVLAIAQAASGLGNTPAVCRRSYVHPDVLDAYLDGSFFEGLRLAARPATPPPRLGLSADERAVLRFLRARCHASVPRLTLIRGRQGKGVVTTPRRTERRAA